MKKKIVSVLFCFGLLAAVRCGAPATAAANDLIVLSPVRAAETVDFYNYKPAQGLGDVRYFLVAFFGATEINTFTIRLSSSPLMKSHEGRVNYVLFALGVPAIYSFNLETATASTVASNSIRAAFPVKSQWGFALVGATVISRHDADDQVKMSIKFSID